MKTKENYEDIDWVNLHSKLAIERGKTNSRLLEVCIQVQPV